MGLGTGTLTPLLNRMQKNGWIRKERSRRDERKVLIYLEPKALEQKTSIINTVQDMIALCNLSQEEVEQLMNQLRMLKDKLEQARRFSQARLQTKLRLSENI